jgi:hypothetical protein
MWHVWKKRGNAHGVLMGKPGRKGKVGGPRLRWDHNIKMDLTEM